MSAYYNEMDPVAAQWLRNLINAGHIAPGYVDERSIADVEADELMGFTQCHFFAGIGVWSHALRRAGWSDDRPIWTGSCPCQPFSAAGQQKGFNDDRHLWPVWYNLIRECRPSVIVGEQVASALDWLDLVSADMEAEGYAFGAADLCAAGFSGAHIRQRLYFAGVAHNQQSRLEGYSRHGDNSHQSRWDTENQIGPVAEGSAIGGLADTHDAGRQLLTGSEPAGVFDQTTGQEEREFQPCGHGTGADRPHAPMLGRYPADWLYCRDGKWRPVEPSTFPLAHEAPARVGRLRAYGNGLDAETATKFVAALMESI